MRLLRFIFTVLILLILCVGAYGQMPVRNPAWVQINPPFEGMELGYSSATVNAFNYYGNYWFDVIPGVVVGAPHNVLSATHADTTPAVLVAGDVLIVDVGGNLVRLPAGALNDVLTQGAVTPAWVAPGGVAHNILSATHLDAAVAALVAGDVMYVDGAGDLNRLAVGANGQILTLVGGFPVWQNPAVTWVQVPESPAIVSGADFTAMVGGAIAGTAADVTVEVSCRGGLNTVVTWEATASRTPIKELVTYYWHLNGGGNLVICIVNDSSMDVYATAQYNEL